jgi:hypothetical protein
VTASFDYALTRSAQDDTYLPSGTVGNIWVGLKDPCIPLWHLWCFGKNTGILRFAQDDERRIAAKKNDFSCAGASAISGTSGPPL